MSQIKLGKWELNRHPIRRNKLPAKKKKKKKLQPPSARIVEQIPPIINKSRSIFLEFDNCNYKLLRVVDLIKNRRSKFPPKKSINKQSD